MYRSTSASLEITVGAFKSATHGKERVRVCIALRAAPMNGQIEKWCCGRNLVYIVTDRWVIHIRANLALKLCVIGESIHAPSGQ